MSPKGGYLPTPCHKVGNGQFSGTVGAMPARTALSLLAAALLSLSVSCDRCKAGIDDHAKAAATASSRTGQSVEIRLLRGQIEIYRRMHEGENPPSLQAMDTLPQLKYAEDYSYDSTTGVISSMRYPGI